MGSKEQRWRMANKLLIFVVCAVLVGCAASGDVSSNTIVGTWSLVSASATTADGAVDAPYGPNPVGYITYTPDGYMHAIVGFSNRPRLSGDWQASPVEERAAAFATLIAYAGRYSVVGGLVEHHVEVSTDPNRVGTSLVRTIQWQRGDLILKTPPIQVGGVVREFALTWRRAEKN
jgi:hypothetical protein